MEAGRFGRIRRFTPSTDQPTGIDWLGKLRGLLEIRFDDFEIERTLNLCLTAAFDYVELATGQLIRTGTVQVEYEYWVGRFPLPFLPVNTLTSITDLDGVAIEYTKKGSTYELTASDGCVITYTGGHGDNCPEGLQLAVLKYALTQYELRSNVAIGTTSTAIPQGADMLLEPYIISQDA